MLLRAVGSVLDQTYRPIEIIIVDDGSTDQTYQVACKLAEDNSEEIRAIQVENGGPGAARQAGLEICHGDFIQFLDSDDMLLPEKFSSQVAALNEHQDCVASYGKTRYYHIGIETPPKHAGKRTGERFDAMFPAHLRSRWWSTSTPLFRKRACMEAGPWSNLRNEEDWEYECRIAKTGGKLVYVDAFLSDTNLHDGERLSSQGSTDPKKLRDRALAHALILDHARSAFISHEQPEMQHFARELFLLARQCGAAGLGKEAANLFALAQSASTQQRAAGLDFVVVGAAAKILGWRAVGRLSRFVDRMREAVAL
jgi:glycosyltransferase involved in cell wall biosynthesis